MPPALRSRKLKPKPKVRAAEEARYEESVEHEELSLPPRKRDRSIARLILGNDAVDHFVAEYSNNNNDSSSFAAVWHAVEALRLARIAFLTTLIVLFGLLLAFVAASFPRGDGAYAASQSGNRDDYGNPGAQQGNSHDGSISLRSVLTNADQLTPTMLLCIAHYRILSLDPSAPEVPDLFATLDLDPYQSPFSSTTHSLSIRDRQTARDAILLALTERIRALKLNTQRHAGGGMRTEAEETKEVLIIVAGALLDDTARGVYLRKIMPRIGKAQEETTAWKVGSWPWGIKQKNNKRSGRTVAGDGRMEGGLMAVRPVMEEFCRDIRGTLKFLGYFTED